VGSGIARPILPPRGRCIAQGERVAGRIRKKA